MEQENTDPRTKRTKQLIKDAFLDLVRKKQFSEISVKDIAQKATVNRATFYAHFTDKYELLDCTIVQSFRDNMMKRIACHAEFNPGNLSHIIVVLCESQRELAQTYRHSCDTLAPMIERRVIDELHKLLLHLLFKLPPDTEPDAGKMAAKDTVANVLSWSIYGAAYSWNHNGRTVSPEKLAESVVPLLMEGLGNYLDTDVAV